MDNINLAYGKDFGDNRALFAMSATATFQAVRECHDYETGCFLRDMPYDRFLRSVYWAAVREYILRIRGRKCVECGREKNLNLHHESYDHRGFEHEHLDDLVILCATCHEVLKHTAPGIAELIKTLSERKKIAFHPWRPVMWNKDYDPNRLPKRPIPPGGILE